MRTAAQDRKSTRLNSSHLVISYAVFCLKKKKNSCVRGPPINIKNQRTHIQHSSSRSVSTYENCIPCSPRLPCRSEGLSLFFFNDTATTEIYTLSLHDALPI